MSFFCAETSWKMDRLKNCFDQGTFGLRAQHASTAPLCWKSALPQFVCSSPKERKQLVRRRPSYKTNLRPLIGTWDKGPFSAAAPTTFSAKRHLHLPPSHHTTPTPHGTRAPAHPRCSHASTGCPHLCFSCSQPPNRRAFNLAAHVPEPVLKRQQGQGHPTHATHPPHPTGPTIAHPQVSGKAAPNLAFFHGYKLTWVPSFHPMCSILATFNPG